MSSKPNINDADALPNSAAAPGVELMQRIHPNGRSNRIAALGVGESHAEAIRLNFDEATRQSLRTAKENLRNTMNRAAANAKQRTGFAFVVETGEILASHSGEIMVVAIVTRTV